MFKLVELDYYQWKFLILALFLIFFRILPTILRRLAEVDTSVLRDAEMKEISVSALDWAPKDFFLAGKLELEKMSLRPLTEFINQTLLEKGSKNANSIFVSRDGTVLAEISVLEQVGASHFAASLLAQRNLVKVQAICFVTVFADSSKLTTYIGFKPSRVRPKGYRALYLPAKTELAQAFAIHNNFVQKLVRERQLETKTFQHAQDYFEYNRESHKRVADFCDALRDPANGERPIVVEDGSDLTGMVTNLSSPESPSPTDSFLT